MAHHTLCYSFVKEEPIDSIDNVTLMGNQDVLNCQNNHSDCESLSSDHGKVKTESTTRDCNQVASIKEEPPQFMSVTHATSGPEFTFDDSEVQCPDPDTLNLHTILKIEEMNVDDLKDDRNIFDKDTGLKQPVKSHMLQHEGHRQKARKCIRKILKPRTMMKIAKNYADLYSGDVVLLSPYPRFRDSTVIQCPACTMPRDQSSHSAFLELLLHVIKRHSDCADSVFYEIGWTYASFIEGLKIKIFKKLKNRYSERLSRL